MFQIDTEDLKPLGDTGEKVPAIGIGTWNISDFKAMEEALVYAVELGLNLVDTAEIYHVGRAEELVGRVAKRVGRDNIFITNKLSPLNLYNVDRGIGAAKNSLERMGISYFDLLLVHWIEPNIPIESYIRSLEHVAKKGYTRYIGVSNFYPDELRRAIEATNKYSIVVNQVKYSVFDKSIEFELLPYAIEEKVTIQAYTPLERGRVSKDRRLRDMGARYGKTPVQVALNYLISHEMVTAIPKSEKKERISEFQGALGWRLEKGDIERLRRI